MHLHGDMQANIGLIRLQLISSQERSMQNTIGTLRRDQLYLLVEKGRLCQEMFTEEGTFKLVLEKEE